MITIQRIKAVSVIVIMSLSAPLLAGGDKLDSIRIIELRANNHSAIVKLADGRKYPLKKGAKIPGTKARVLEVFSNKLVVEEVVETDNSLDKQEVEVYKPKSPGGVSEIKRLNNNGYTRRALRLPKEKP